MTRRLDERGSGTLIVLAAALLVLSAGLAAVLWAAVSTAQHRAAAAADLVALSAAQAIQMGDEPCATARRIAAAHLAEVAECRVDGEVVWVVAGVRAQLGSLGRPLVTVPARAGPIGPP
jgi:secretion/DNA translocation related TadE-like protein